MSPAQTQWKFSAHRSVLGDGRRREEEDQEDEQEIGRGSSDKDALDVAAQCCRGMEVFLGINGYPQIASHLELLEYNYRDCFIGISTLQECMSLSRLWAL